MFPSQQSAGVTVMMSVIGVSGGACVGLPMSSLHPVLTVIGIVVVLVVLVVEVLVVLVVVTSP